MLNLNTKLTVLHDDNSTFEDHSDKAHSYVRDSFVFDYTTSEDALYIGYSKPINVFYTELEEVNAIDASLTIQYYKGGTTNAFTSISSVIDDTEGLTRSGFIQWPRDLEDEEETTVNGTEQYWYKLTWDATLSGSTEIKGINIVFSDDQDLKSRVPNISATKYLADGEKSHILSHVAARDEILQRLSNDGRFKANFLTGVLSELNQFDILNVNQLRNASKMYALYVIFDDLSDDPDDRYGVRASQFISSFNQIYNNIRFLDIDVDDDGKSDQYEEMASSSSELKRR
jgi:hypothetical protein